jgi:pimeloyl-ACP methyl ester carboxylesterase
MVGERITLARPGAQLAIWRGGEGLPVVFLHAGVCDTRMWSEQMAAVEQIGWQAIAYDQRGFGQTEAEAITFSPLDDLAAVLDATEVHAAVFVGCSNGGRLALDFALRHPGRVIGLVLIGTSVSGAPWFVTEAEAALEMAEEDAWERGDRDMLNRVMAHEWLDGPRARSGRVGGAARELFLDMNAIALAKQMSQSLVIEPEREAWPSIEAVSAPTLLIVGDEDFSALVDRHETLSERMPNAFATVLEGCAHIPSIERPELVNALLVEFLDALLGGDDEDEADDEDDIED